MPKSNNQPRRLPAPNAPLSYLIRPLLMSLLLLLAMPLHARPLIIATTPALAQIAEAIGGVEVDVHSLNGLGKNPYYFNPKPGHARLLMQADLLFAAGYGLEASWLPSLIQLSGNRKLEPGQKGYLAGSDALEAMGVSRAFASSSLKEYTADTPPLWWLNPLAGIKVARMLAIRLIEIDPLNASTYRRNADTFSNTVLAAIPRWRADLQALNTPVVAYNNSFAHLLDAMGLQCVGLIAPRDGIEPSTRHLQRVIQSMRKQDLHLIWVEPYHLGPVVKRVAQETDARLLVLPDAIEGQGLAAYTGLFDYLVDRIRRWNL